jgi:two-component system chemotaxis response regulator CheB
VTIDTGIAAGHADRVTAPARDIVVCGGSAGGIRAVGELLAGLPAQFPAALFVVLHRAPEWQLPDRIAEVLASRSAMPVQSARDEQPIRPGHVYVGPSDRHGLAFLFGTAAGSIDS